MANLKKTNVIKGKVVDKSEPIKGNLTSYNYATTEKAGIIRIATDNEANLGTSDNTAITPHTLKAKADYLDNKIGEINTTLNGFGDIVTHNKDEFATAEQGGKADTALQPNDKISLMDNDAGYISSITSLDVTTALGYTPYNATNPNGYQANVIEDIKVNDVSQTVTSKSVNIIVPTVNNATLTIQKNSTDVGTFTSNASVDKIINLLIPTNASDVNALPNTTKYGESIDLSLNTADYKLTMTLKDQNGDTLNSKVVDFPIESVVVNGSYDDNTQKIVLTLQNGNTIDIPVGGLISGLQTEITSNNKLDADLVDDSSSTNKFVTSNEKTTWNGKQDAISDLSTIRSNAENGQSAYTTISNYGDIPTHNVSEFATSAQGSLADSALQNGSDVINALGYTPYNSTNPNNYSSTISGLIDVDLTNPTQGQNLTYDAVNQKWINSSTTATVGWGGITGTLSDQTDLQNALNAKQNVIDADNKLNASYISGLGAVATSNDYNDLSNKPTLSTVATSGSYNDLSNKPTIPTDVSDLTNTSLANVSLSNLNTNGENRLYALKGYNDNGQILSDAILYNYIKSCYDNSFDLSKFTVVGTPTISADGILTNADEDTNYIYIPETTIAQLSTANTWKIKWTGTLQTNGFCFAHYYSNGTGVRSDVIRCNRTTYAANNFNVYINVDESGTRAEYSLFATLDTTYNGKSYICTLEFTGTQYVWTYQFDNENAVTQTLNNTNKLYNYNYGDRMHVGQFSTGSIDLKAFSITVGGVEVFNGHKTGTDTYYTDDYTVVGSPTITDGVMSNITVNDYATTGTSFVNNLGSADTWEIEVPIIMPNPIVNANRYFMTGDSENSFQTPMFGVKGDGKIYYWISFTGTGWVYNAGYGSTDAFSAGAYVNVRLKFNGTQYLLYTKLSGEDWKLQNTQNFSNKIYSGNCALLFGFYQKGVNNYIYNGSIDIGNVKVRANGKLIYTPNLVIPYKKTNNDILIADADYREEVLFVNDKYGYSPYFTIDKINGNVTLPMPDLYSMIAKSTPEYLKTVSGYDGTATQTLKNVNGVLQWVSDT